MLIAGAATVVRAGERVTWQAKDGVELNELLRERIGAVAEIYYAKTKRRLVITSGYRSPARQAAAMYAKLRAGSSLGIYRRPDLIRPLKKAYRNGRRGRWKKAAIIAAMTEILEQQVARGVYLSRHMQGRAFDVRSRGLSSRQRAALGQAIREVGGMRLTRERRPPHYHIEITAD